MTYKSEFDMMNLKFDILVLCKVSEWRVGARSGGASGAARGKETLRAQPHPQNIFKQNT